jgi:hypothetical protein
MNEHISASSFERTHGTGSAARDSESSRTSSAPTAVQEPRSSRSESPPVLPALRAPRAPSQRPRSVASVPPAPKPQALPGTHVVRSRAYAFVLDAAGQPTELGSGRFAKAYLGEELWLESKTAFRRQVAIKILQKGVSEENALRFQLEKELLERVQGHPHIITLYASGESDNPEFIPPSLRDKVENDFMACATICWPTRCASGCSACSNTCCRWRPRSSARTSSATSCTAI